MLFLAVIWSIWLHRNQMVFNGQIWDVLQLLNLIKCRYAFWFHAKWPNSGLTVDDILRGFEASPKRKSTTIRETIEWRPPHLGHTKFNVDGAAIGKPGAAGIGGILRDSNGKVCVTFSKSVGIEDSNAAELMAIREALLIFKTSRWAELPLIVESDSKNAVKWFNHPDEAPWRLRNIINYICYLKHGMVQWQCVHIFREANNEADLLAKQGVNRTTDIVTIHS